MVMYIVYKLHDVRVCDFFVYSFQLDKKSACLCFVYKSYETYILYYLYSSANRPWCRQQL